MTVDEWQTWGPDTWRTWSAQRRQDEVSPSSKVPQRDISPWLADYARLGRSALSEAPHGVTTLGYGDHPDEVVSWVPAGPDPAPLVVFIHGGYWAALSHTDGLFAGPSLAAAGIHYASVNYTLAPSASLEEIVDQCRRAVRFVLDERSLPVDRRRVVLAGHSAGGHLAAMCAEEVDDVALLGFSGVFDLEPLIGTTVDGPLGLDPGRARALSPLRRPAPAVRQALMVVGEHDPDHFKYQTMRYADHVDGEWQVCPGANHFDVILALADPGSTVRRWIDAALQPVQ